jgi:hypothetical protein
MVGTVGPLWLFTALTALCVSPQETIGGAENRMGGRIHSGNPVVSCPEKELGKLIPCSNNLVYGRGNTAVDFFELPLI